MPVILFLAEDAPAKNSRKPRMQSALVITILTGRFILTVPESRSISENIREAFFSVMLSLSMIRASAGIARMMPDSGFTAWLLLTSSQMEYHSAEEPPIQLSKKFNLVTFPFTVRKLFRFQMLQLTKCILDLQHKKYQPE